MNRNVSLKAVAVAGACSRFGSEHLENRSIHVEQVERVSSEMAPSARDLHLRAAPIVCNLFSDGCEIEQLCQMSWMRQAPQHARAERTGARDPERREHRVAIAGGAPAEGDQPRSPGLRRAVVHEQYGVGCTPVRRLADR